MFVEYYGIELAIEIAVLIEWLTILKFSNEEVQYHNSFLKLG